MPELKLKHIVSCSSEDHIQRAENLLKPETYYKWKCKSGEEKNATIIVQLEKEEKITSLDIGNNGSAFVEVLVGKSTWGPDEEYKVLLVASSFMSPSESKQGTNLHRVRMFGPENLNKATLDQKWDRIKIVCTQLYNKNSGYGLSFITLHSKEDKSKEDSSTTDQAPALKKIGSFRLRDEPDAKISIGSFFQRKNLTSIASSSSSKSMAAAARDSSATALQNKATATATTLPKPSFLTSSKKEEKRKELGTTSQLAKSKSDPSTSSSLSLKKREHPSPSFAQTPPPPKRQKSDPVTSRESSKPKERKRTRKQVSYHRILRGVVFAISGYQNPERGKLRDRATAMGAEYRPDWVPGCTHLLCAFKNTPKFNQVKGKGKIVCRRWIDDCHQKKQRLSLKGYRLDGGESSSSYSESEDEEPTKVAMEVPQPGAAKLLSGEADALMKKEQLCEIRERDEVQEKRSASSSDCDTMDELEKVRKEQEEDPYGGTTEEEDYTTLGKDVVLVTKSSVQLPELPNFFDGKSFLLYGDFEEEERRLLTRYITAYDGHVEDYMGDSIGVVITNADWDQNFDQALKDNPSLDFVRPLWIFKCHELGRLADMSQFLLTH